MTPVRARPAVLALTLAVASLLAPQIASGSSSRAAHGSRLVGTTKTVGRVAPRFKRTLVAPGTQNASGGRGGAPTASSAPATGLATVTPTPTPTATSTPAPPKPRLFASDSIWNAPLARNAPLDPASAAMSAAFRTEIQREITANIGPWLSTSGCAPRIYTVPLSQKKVRITLDNATLGYKVTLQKAFESVPLPADARPATCSDKHLTLYQPSTDRTWDFWRLRREADGWHAAWGGAMGNVSTSPGYYSAQSWPGGQTNWGASATSLPLLAGVIRISELEAGRIDHALELHIPEARRGVQAWPAQRNDGRNDDPASLPEGAHLRIDPALNLDSLKLPPVTLTIARAAQRYGMVVRDVTHHATMFSAEDPFLLKENPYPRLFAGRSKSQLMQAFPWGHLQVLRMDLYPKAP